MTPATVAGLRVTALRPGFVLELAGSAVDARHAADGVAAIRAALDRFGVLVFRDCLDMDDAALEAFSRAFGPLFSTAQGFGGDRAVLRLGNLDADGAILPPDDRFRAVNRANALWHVDNSFSEPPAKYSVLLARVIPPTGGETEFADAPAAYDALPPDNRQDLEGLQAIHSYAHSRALSGVALSEAQQRDLPERIRPLVLHDARTARCALYLASHIRGLVGWDERHAQARVAELIAFAPSRSSSIAMRGGRAIS